MATVLSPAIKVAVCEARRAACASRPSCRAALSIRLLARSTRPGSPATIAATGSIGASGGSAFTKGIGL
jgi:hypothetical protein